MNNKKTPLQITGASSLLVIFSVLCLCVFSLITLSSVLAEKRINTASVKAISDYYAADTYAQEVIADIKSGNIPDFVSEENGIYSFTCKVSDKQDLQVEIRKDTWEIINYSTVSTHSWEEESLELWDGSTDF